MAEDPQAAAAQRSDESPKLFKNMNGVIAGVTGLVVALGGLATAYKQFFDKPAERQAAVTESQAPADRAAPAAGEEEPAEDPGFYDTDADGTLRFIDGLWVETAKDGTKYRYEEISNDGTMTVAIDRGGGEEGEDVYLRWPNQGGQAQKSWDRQANWSDAFNVYPKEEPA